MNKQNKRKLYTFRHMWIRQALKPANDTRDQALSYANNTKWNTNHNRLGQSREIYSNSVPLSPPHWPYPKRIRPPSWPRVAVASSIQNTKRFTWRTWPGAGAVPKCDWVARSQSVSKQRRADHTKYQHLICCDAWPIRYHYWTNDCINIITRMAMHYLKCNRMEYDNILLSHTCNTANWHAHK